LGIGPHSSYGRPMERGRPLYFHPVVSSIFLFSSPNLSRRRLDVFHTSFHSTHGVEGSANLECMYEMCCTRLVENTGCKNDKKFPSRRHRTTLSGYIFATKSRINNRKKNLLSSNISSTCSYNMVNFGPLAAEIVSLVWGTLANFNGFRVLASLLQRSCSTEANQTLNDVWSSPAQLHYIYIFGGCCPVTEFC